MTSFANKILFFFYIMASIVFFANSTVNAMERKTPEDEKPVTTLVRYSHPLLENQRPNEYALILSGDYLRVPQRGAKHRTEFLQKSSRNFPQLMEAFDALSRHHVFSQPMINERFMQLFLKDISPTPMRALLCIVPPQRVLGHTPAGLYLQAGLPERFVVLRLNFEPAQSIGRNLQQGLRPRSIRAPEEAPPLSLLQQRFFKRSQAASDYVEKYPHIVLMYLAVVMTFFYHLLRG